MRRLLCSLALLSLAPTAYAAAQDSVTVAVSVGSVLRFTFGRVQSTTLEGRLDRSDSAIVRVMVGGEAGDVRLRADRLGLTVAESGAVDSMIVAVPWRLVRIVEIAAGRQSRRIPNGIMGGLIGAGVGGGVGAVLGATMSSTSCAAAASTNCGISSETGKGAVIGAVAGLLAGAMVAAFREAYEILWVPLPERGRVLRQGLPRR